jgi:hypothetical protein
MASPAVNEGGEQATHSGDEVAALPEIEPSVRICTDEALDRSIGVSVRLPPRKMKPVDTGFMLILRKVELQHLPEGTPRALI